MQNIIQTYNLCGIVYASMRIANQPGGYIAHGRNVQEAIKNLFIIYNKDGDNINIIYDHLANSLIENQK